MPKGNELTDDTGKSVEDLTKELVALRAKHASLEGDVTNLKEDLRVAKASTADVTSLNKQMDRLIAEKSALMGQVEDGKKALKDFKAEIATEKVKTTLATALDTAGARSSKTAMKLIDMSVDGLVDEHGNVVQAKIDEQIAALKTDSPDLFKDGGDPAPKPGITNLPVKNVSDRLTNSAFQTELEAASKTGKQSEIDAVVAKHGIA